MVVRRLLPEGVIVIYLLFSGISVRVCKQGGGDEERENNMYGDRWSDRRLVSFMIYICSRFLSC